MNLINKLGLSLCVMALAIGCADDSDDTSTPGDMDPTTTGDTDPTTTDGTGTVVTLEEEACIHMQSGPFADAVTATTEAAGAPAVAIAHTSVPITLVEDADNPGQYMGYASFASDEATEYAFFLSSDVPMTIYDATDTEIEIEASSDVAECTEVAKKHLADLEIGTYALYFGPTTESSLSFVFEEASHEGHDDHGHDDHDDHGHDDDGHDDDDHDDDDHGHDDDDHADDDHADDDHADDGDDHAGE